MSDYLCHDFKTPRTDTSRRLPPTFRLVPVIFYISLAGTAYFMIMDWTSYKRAEKEKQEAAAVKTEHEQATEALNKEKAAIDAETSKAEQLAKWMEGARNVQPISVAIARAMPPEVRLSNLSLERSDQVPANLSLTVRLNGGSAQEVGIMETSLSRLNYRSYSPQQIRNGEIIEYRSTLVRQAH